MKTIYNIICIPSLLVHEILHILMCLLVFSKWTGIKISKFDDFNNTFGFSFTVFTVSKYRIQNTLIHLAPFLAIFISPIVYIYSVDLAIIILMYQLITISVIKPSNEDYLAIKEFKTLDELFNEINTK